MLVFFDTFKFADNLNYCKNEALLNFKKTYEKLIIIHDLVIKNNNKIITCITKSS